MENESEIIAALHQQTLKAISCAKRAIDHEKHNHYEQAIVEYGKSVKILYNAYCFLAGITLNKSRLKDGASTKVMVDFSRGYISEAITNKLMEIYNRIQRLENFISSGTAEVNSLMHSIDIPLQMFEQTLDNSNTAMDNIKDVLVQLEVNDNTHSFDNIIGHEQIKMVLKQLSYSFTLNTNENTKKIFVNRYVSSNKMVILYGPPGTGKTSLVTALAQYLKIPLYELKLSALYNKYVGESEKLMSLIFEWILSSTSPKVIFIDELDSLFSKRGMDNEESIDKKLKIIFMTEMNRFNTNLHTNTLLVGATNLLENIDEAIVRRSVLNIEVTKPTSREEYAQLVMYEIHHWKVNVDNKVIQQIIDTVYNEKYSQSKVNDVVKKIFSMVTSQLSTNIYVRQIDRSLGPYYSLTSRILAVGEDKYTIVQDGDLPVRDGDKHIDLNSDDIAKDLTDFIVLPFFTETMWQSNAQIFH